MQTKVDFFEQKTNSLLPSFRDTSRTRRQPVIVHNFGSVICSPQTVTICASETRRFLTPKSVASLDYGKSETGAKYRQISMQSWSLKPAPPNAEIAAILDAVLVGE